MLMTVFDFGSGDGSVSLHFLGRGKEGQELILLSKMEIGVEFLESRKVGCDEQWTTFLILVKVW